MSQSKLPEKVVYLIQKDQIYEDGYLVYRIKRNKSFLLTFVNDMSSGTTYGDGFKNGARSMYISKSSEVRCISSMHNPLDETGLANSLKLCLEIAESIYLSDKVWLISKKSARKRRM